MSAVPISVRERSTVTISESEYRLLEGSDAVLELVSQGVVSLVRSRTTPYGVKAGSLVGEAVVGAGRRLIVAEKVPGSLHALLRWAVPRDFRSLTAPAYVDADSPVLEVFAARFLDILARYLQRGRIKEYARLYESSSRPRGRLDLQRTVRLRSRGNFTHLGHITSELDGDTLINQLMALGLHAVEAYANVAGAAPALRSRARSYAALFSDVQTLWLQRASRSAKTDAFESALSDSRSVGDVSDALSYARALVLNLGAWPLAEEQLIPESYFLNLETLFEDAVRQVASESRADIRVDRGRALKHPLFRDREDDYIADPDLVLSHSSERPVVADCKYKDLKGRPDHGDVYQLVAHAQAFGASTAVLIYPGVSYDYTVLGTTVGGISVSWARVRSSELESDVASVVNAVAPPTADE
jgi:5-methylcytosine-specific restriction endonuclease McrBC regulatory subunit McrC